jgi:predicted glycoside hydrolase/deacetylase ChbG (UPF0249 family)
MVSGANAESQILAALGLPQETRALVVHADDAGMSWAADSATIDAMERGSVTCASTMVPCPWFPATVRACKKNPSLDMGIHLTLTNEWGVYRWGPIADRSIVPKLVDEDGYMWPDVMPVYKSVGEDIGQVMTEVQAQIDFARNMGLEPTHIDSHMGTLFYNEHYFKATCNLALKNDLPFMAFGYNDELAERTGNLLPYYDESVVEALRKAGFPLLDGFMGEELVGETYEEGFQNYCKFLSELKPGVTLLIVHLGKDGEELENITSRHWARDQQYRIFTDLKMAETIEKEGIHLLGWRDIKEAVWDKRDKSIEKAF